MAGRWWCGSGAADAVPGSGLPGADVPGAGPGVLDRYQRRTARLARQAGEVTRRLAGRAGAGLLAALGVPLSRHTALRLLLRLALPEVAVPRVLGVDDFALRRGQVCATILTGAETGQRAGVLASRKADVLEGGCAGIPACRSYAVTGPAPMARRSAARCPARSRPVTAGICGTCAVRR